MGEAVKKSGQDVDREVVLGVDRLVDTIWHQYEQSVDRAREFREKREDAYINTLKEVIKFNQEFRNSLSKLYETSKMTNNEMVKGVSGNLLKKAEERNMVSHELTNQWEEVTNRAEKLVAAPIKASLELIERFENNLAEGGENYVNYVRERRSGWQKVTNEYVKAARTNNKKLVHRFEDSFKALAKTK